MIKAAINPTDINTQSSSATPSFPTYNPAQQNRTFMTGASMPPASVQATETSSTKPLPTSAPSNPTAPVMPALPKFPDPTQTNLVMADGTIASANGSNSEKKNSGQPKKKLSLKMALGVIVLFLVILGSGAGFYLTQQSQDLRQQASSTCVEQCPSSDGVLINCTPPIADESSTVGMCNADFLTKIESCGGTTYCCNGTSWTTDMTVCTTEIIPVPECNGDCTIDSECSDINPSWICNATSHKCRLASNPDSAICEEAHIALACNSDCTTDTECSSVVPDWTCDATSNKCRLASNPTSITCEPAVVPTSKTWNVTTSFICPDGSTPSTIGRRLFWVVWPPSPLTWYYNPILSLVDGSTTEITQAITVDNITPGLVKSVYVGLAKASDLDNFDAKAYKAINPPTGVTAATYFNPPTEMFNWSVINDTVPTNMTLKFEAPEELCEPTTLTCNDACTTNTQCSNINPYWTCDATSNKCRLAINPTSTTCEVEVLDCNDACNTDAECSAVNPDWICNGANKCVLASNPTSTTCAEEVNNVSCDGFTGTLTAGTVTDQTTEMNYSLTYSGGTQVTSAQVTIHGNFDGPGWVDTWADLGVDTTLTDGVFSGTTTYDDIIDLLVATGHDRQQIIDEGVIYSADVYSAAGFCQSDNTLSISGEVCEFNSKCQGLIELKATDTTELSCNDSCTTNAQCSDVNSNWYCDPDSDKCRRESNPTSTNCAVKIVNDDSDDPAAIVGCNETCVTNSDCTNNDHICVTTADGSNRCRLESYTSSVSCVLPTGATPQPSLPPALPQTGPEDWLNWLKAGLITLGIGSVLFFLL